MYHTMKSEINPGCLVHMLFKFPLLCEILLRTMRVGKTSFGMEQIFALSGTAIRMSQS